ncbi:serine threonine protein kinase [Musa troglodytarum]|uniref:Serine threonine protein kinase n=1 Tax=Musa troglodytarum TaxID=320322 RepID=A0A9E7HBF9_9LILI|nr:serine threonine protein kinase [Musa troglodytarum]
MPCCSFVSVTGTLIKTADVKATATLQRSSFKNELTLMQKARRHPNVVQFVGAVTQNLPMMIVSEHLPKVRFIGARNVLLDDGGRLKMAGFGSIKMLKVSHDRCKLVNPMTDTNNKIVGSHCDDVTAQVCNACRRTLLPNKDQFLQGQKHERKGTHTRFNEERWLPRVRILWPCVFRYFATIELYRSLDLSLAPKVGGGGGGLSSTAIEPLAKSPILFGDCKFSPEDCKVPTFPSQSAPGGEEGGEWERVAMQRSYNGKRYAAGHPTKINKES